jgi:hypothetical protein
MEMEPVDGGSLGLEPVSCSMKGGGKVGFLAPVSDRQGHSVLGNSLNVDRVFVQRKTARKHDANSGPVER